MATQCREKQTKSNRKKLLKGYAYMVLMDKLEAYREEDRP